MQPAPSPDRRLYALRLLVAADSPADVRDFGNAILDGVRAAEKSAPEDSLYRRVKVRSLRLTPALEDG
jgi:hypothetical protein